LRPDGDGAVYDSSGAFTVDSQRALELLQGALTFDSEDTVLFALLAALMGASKVSVGRWGTNSFLGVRVLDNGPRLSPGQAEQLVGAELTMDERLFWLFRALQAGRKLGARYFSGRLRLGWESGKLKCLRGFHGEGDLLGRNFFEVPIGLPHVSARIRRLTQFDPLPRLRGAAKAPGGKVKIPPQSLASTVWLGPEPLQVEGPATWTAPSPLAASAAFWLHPPGVRQGRLTLLKQGLWLETVDLKAGCWPWSGVVRDDGVAHDLGGKIRRDEHFRRLVDLLEQQAEEMLSHIPPEQKSLPEADEAVSQLEPEMPALPLLPGIFDAKLSCDGQRLLTCSSDQVRLWKLTPENQWELLVAMPGSGCMAFSPDGRQFALGFRGQVRLFDSHQGRALRVWPHPVSALRFSPVENVLYVLKGFEVLRLSLDSHEEFHLLNLSPKFDLIFFKPMELSPNGRVLVVNQLGRVTVVEFSPLGPVISGLECFSWLAFLPNGQGLLTRDKPGSNVLTLRRFTNLQQGLPLPLPAPPGGANVLIDENWLYRNDLGEAMNWNTGQVVTGAAVPEVGDSSEQQLVHSSVWFSGSQGVRRLAVPPAGTPEVISSWFNETVQRSLTMQRSGEHMLLRSVERFESYDARTARLHSRVESTLLCHHNQHPLLLEPDGLRILGCNSQLHLIVKLPQQEVEIREGRLLGLFPGGKVRQDGTCCELQIEGCIARAQEYIWYQMPMAGHLLLQDGEDDWSLFHPQSGLRALPKGFTYKALGGRFLLQIPPVGDAVCFTADSWEKVDMSRWGIRTPFEAVGSYFYNSGLLVDGRGQVVRKVGGQQRFVGADPSHKWLFVYDHKKQTLSSQELVSGRPAWTSAPVGSDQVGLNWCETSNTFCGGGLKARFDPDTGTARMEACGLDEAIPMRGFLVAPMWGGASFFTWKEELVARLFLFEDGYLLVDRQGHYEARGEAWEGALGPWRKSLRAQSGLFESLWSSPDGDPFSSNPG